MKKYGWAIRNKKTGLYHKLGEGSTCSANLKDACVFDTRFETRHVTFVDETIDIVALNKHGRPYKVIGRG